ncbi:tail protein X [Agrobacterium sp. MS2]|uniref:tail protein X n=1 Tax=Agrobacterium sp. MS2 TaxID=1345498 RepID=UPI000DAFABB5|nr:tail protein X [Agrobacterium sp. MS2]PZP59495.1 MAG: hypothetical protein DI604_32325 [Delftia acidovorans]RAL95618.1 hypothetical protein DOU54_20905 [Agrobacterium sp. MS2]
MSRYTVKLGGERLDRLAKKLMQTEKRGTVEALLRTNPDLAARLVDGVVPAGTVIEVPEAFEPDPVESFTLAWE